MARDDSGNAFSKKEKVPLLISNFSIFAAAALSAKLFAGKVEIRWPAMLRILRFPKICNASCGNFSRMLFITCNSCNVLFTPRKLCSSINLSGVSTNLSTRTSRG